MRPPKRIPSGPLALAVLASGLSVASCGVESTPDELSGEGALVIEGATVFPTPRTPPIQNGAVLVVDGVIEAVGVTGDFLVPASAIRINGDGLSVLAGFWNAHTKVDEALLEAAAVTGPAELEELIRDRYTRFGFTSIVDTGTPLEELSVLIDRIQSGEVMGPRIVSAEGGGLARVWLPSSTRPMWSVDEAEVLVAGDVAVVPGFGFIREGTAVGITLDDALDRLHGFLDIGGRLVFGTGAGYNQTYDPLPDHFLLEDAGVPFAARLAALTSEPAVRYGYDYAGEIETGMVADLVLLEGDPEVDVTAFGRVYMVLREARALFW